MPPITIQSISVEVKERYQPGHVCTEVEATALNQTLYENLRNNFSTAIKKAKEEHGDALPPAIVAKLRREFAAYADSYVFRGRKVAVPVDPVERLARKLAKDKLRERITAQGMDFKSLSPERLEALIDDALAKTQAFMNEAKRRLDATKSLALDVLDDSDLEAAE